MSGHPRHVAWLMAAVMLLPAAGCSTPSPSVDEHFFRGEAVWDATVAPDFALVDQHGQSFRLSDQRDSVVLLFFGYV
ncbi:MAG: hypothetical protein GY946_11870, partial [bacterium]|nr:hypothetical protein [bacterium]